MNFKTTTGDWRSRGTLVLLVIVLASCSGTFAVRDPAFISDRGGRNAVLLSYDIQLHAARIHPTDRDTRLDIECIRTDDSNRQHDCLSFVVPFRGSDSDGGLALGNFLTDGAGVFRLGHGEYTLKSVSYAVVVEQMEYKRCHEDERGYFRCETRYVDRYDYSRAELPVPISFRIDAGSGCYLGHLTLTLRGDEVQAYALHGGDFDAAKTLVAEPLQKVLTRHVTRRC